MNLTEALWVLDRAHTRDDAEAGYLVETYPNTWESGAGEYIEAWGVVRAHLRSQREPITNFQATFENGQILIHVEVGGCVGDFTLSDQFMAGVRATFTEELREALEAALPDLHILDSRLQAEAERAECGYTGLESLRLVEAALEKVGER